MTYCFIALVGYYQTLYCDWKTNITCELQWYNFIPTALY